jgi:hypothetical protein
MARVKLVPTDSVPLPYSPEDVEVEGFMDELTVSANTAGLFDDLGIPLEVDPVNFEREKALIDGAIKGQHVAPLTNYATALGAKAFLQQYGQGLAMDVGQVRMALTNKLMEIANCGETKYELKALELLGKHSDVGLFKERSEININYNSPDALEAAIKERVKRLLDAEVIDVTPINASLDDELGVFAPEEPEEETDVYDALAEDDDILHGGEE